MKRAAGFTVLFLFVLITSFTPVNDSKPAIGVKATTQYFREGAEAYAAGIRELSTAVKLINKGDTVSVQIAKEQLTECRRRYKRIEFFVEYFFENRIKIFNLAPVYEIEEPYMEYQSPVGMQVVEAHLFDDEPAEHKEELLAETEVLYTTAISLPGLLHDRNVTDEEILESLRLELVRIITLGITGYDAPELKTGIPEALAAMQSFRDNLAPYRTGNNDSTFFYAEKAIALLDEQTDFAGFDRPGFIVNAMLPLQRQLNNKIHELQLPLHTAASLNYKAAHIFSKDVFNLSSFSTDSFSTSEELVALGKALFFEKKLSGNNNRSCATCHVPEKYFADGLITSLAFDEKAHVTRNAPSLLYAAFQHGQFLDARVKSMTEQIKIVLASPVEMNASFPEVVNAIRKDKRYRKLFGAAFSEANDKAAVTIDNIAIAITAFERSLPVMTSRFDEYMNGNPGALTADEQKGFNLFMGKAQCGSCHFAPLFNGLLPPYYDITELESLGLTSNTDHKRPVADTDSGRFKVFPIEFYVGAFKTPTVRNSAMTAPYMHNGAFNTLEEVVEFYNEGGGKGLGLDNPFQTLSSKKINLSKEEVSLVVSFLGSLTDKPAGLTLR